MANVIVHSRPVEEGVDGSVGSFNSLVPCDGGIVVVMEDLCMKGTLGNAETVEVISEGSIRAQAVTFQERGRHGFVNRESSQGTKDGAEFRCLFEVSLELCDE
jgi:hypothetical protein